jgi:BolA protein
MRLSEKIRENLQSAFAPHQLEVFDESEMHRGHGGYREGGESHFRIVMRSPVFAGKSRIARHRAVHAALGPDLVASIHALSLDLDC